jgi:hypothetical protein
VRSNYDTSNDVQRGWRRGGDGLASGGTGFGNRDNMTLTKTFGVSLEDGKFTRAGRVARIREGFDVGTLSMSANPMLPSDDNVAVRRHISPGSFGLIMSPKKYRVSRGVSLNFVSCAAIALEMLMDEVMPCKMSRPWKDSGRRTEALKPPSAPSLTSR